MFHLRVIISLYARRKEILHCFYCLLVPPFPFIIWAQIWNFKLQIQVLIRFLPIATADFVPYYLQPMAHIRKSVESTR